MLNCWMITIMVWRAIWGAGAPSAALKNLVRIKRKPKLTRANISKMSNNSWKTCCQSCLKRRVRVFNKLTRTNTIKVKKHCTKQSRLLVGKEMRKNAFTGRSVTLMRYRFRWLAMLDHKRLSVGGSKMKSWDPCCSSRSHVTVAITLPILLKTDRETYSSIRIRLGRRTRPPAGIPRATTPKGQTRTRIKNQLV